MQIISRLSFTAVMIISLFSVVLTGCGGGGGNGSNGNNSGGSGNGNTVQVSGTLDKSSGYQVAVKSSSIFYAKAKSVLGFGSLAYAAPTDPTVDQVLAIPMSHGSLRADMMANSKYGIIDSSTGAFSLSLDTNHDWLLMLINSSSTGTTRFVGSLALNAGSSNSLLNFPATNSKLGAMPLGTVSKSSSNGDALSSKVVGAADFNLSASQLATLAKTDRSFRNAMNIVNNYGTFGNAPGVWYQLRPDFHWSGSLSSIVSGGALGSAPTLAYTGMNFQLDTNSTSVVMTNVCNTAGYVALHPPQSAGNVVIGNKTYSYSTPIQNSGSGCQLKNGTSQETINSDIYANNAHLPQMTYSVKASFTSNTIPSGFWEWHENGTVKASFDLSSINPPITAAGQLQGYLPAFRVNVDGNKKITSIDIAWFYYDNGTYVPVSSADLTVLSHVISQVEAKFDVTYNGTRRTCEMYIDPSVETSFNPADPRFASTCQADSAHKDWYYNDTTHPETNTGLMGFYESGGFGYFFEYSLDTSDPHCILPIPDAEIKEVTKGQQYNPPGHTGLDFGFTPTSGQYVLRDILAPLSGTVTGITGHYVGGDNTYAYTVEIGHNDAWSTFICFEPQTTNQALIDLQGESLAVSVGQKIKQGDVIGQLVVSSPSSALVFGPHVHWQLYRNNTSVANDVVCPRTYSTPQANTALDSLYTSVGITQPCAVP